MHMRWLIAICRVEEEPVRPLTMNGRHKTSVPLWVPRFSRSGTRLSLSRRDHRVRPTAAAHPRRPLLMSRVNSFAARPPSGAAAVGPRRLVSHFNHGVELECSAFPWPSSFGTSGSSLSMRCPSRAP
jgi:hypothetical protein